MHNGVEITADALNFARLGEGDEPQYHGWALWDALFTNDKKKADW